MTVQSVGARPVPLGNVALARIPLPLAVWLVACGLYLWPAVNALQLGPDQVEYIDIARRLVRGEGYVLGIKAFHFGGTDVLHNGLAERPPLFPLLVAAIQALGLGLVWIQVVNGLLAGACAALICAIGRQLFGTRTGALAGLLTAASPVMLERTLTPMTEALATALVLLALWLIVRRFEAPTMAAFGLAGVALGLGYLTRPTVGGLTCLVVAGTVVASRNRRSLIGLLTALFIGLALFAAPITLYSLVTRGSPSYLGQDYLFAVYRDSDVMHDGYVSPITTASAFISANPAWVAAAVGRRTLGYLELVFLNPAWLLPFIVAWPVVVVAAVRGKYQRAAVPVLLVAAGNFAMHCLTWSNFADRYHLLTHILLLPFLVDGLQRVGLDRITILKRFGLSAFNLAIVAVLVLWSSTWVRAYRGQYLDTEEIVGIRTDDGLRWTGPPDWVNDDDIPALAAWIRDRTHVSDVIASDRPWVFTFFTHRPSTLLPWR
jgi:4-amino-4-deoxy-L-arabinose transferase-like glycosyltransferase